MLMIKRFITILLVTLGLSSCGGSSSLLPSISGAAGEILIVIDKDSWEGGPGTELRALLACDCPYLFTREPLYTLVNVTPNAFSDLFKVHRNIILINIDPQVCQEGLIYRSDAWARPQCVIQLSAATEDNAVDLIRKESANIVGYIEQAERNRVISNTLMYEESSIADRVCEVFGGSPHFPMGYTVKKITKDFAWIADEKQYTMQGVLIYKYPVGDDVDPFSKESIIAHRNAALMANVPGMFEGTYMTTSDFIEPTVSYMKYKKIAFAQTRGYWEVHNDYMGGPFVSHSMYSPDGEEILVLDAFLYAPKYDKRQYLRQVESLLYSFSWKGEEE